MLRLREAGIKKLGRAWFWAERQLCRIPGFMMAYGDASDAWSRSLDKHVQDYLTSKGGQS